MIASLDATISLGNVLTILITLGGMVVAVWRVTMEFTRLKTKILWMLNLLWRDYCQRKNLNGDNTDESE